MKKFLTFFAVAAVAVVAAVSCENKQEPVKPAEVALTGIAINPAGDFSLEVGATKDLSVTYTPENATNKPAVEWISSAPAVATVAAGKVTAVAPGEAEITAKAGTFTAKVKVTVTAPAEIALTGISIEPAGDFELEIGGTKDLAVKYAPENATNKPAATWTSSAEAVATVAAGKVTAVAAGEAEITATVGEFTAKVKVTVKAAAPFEDKWDYTPGEDYISGTNLWFTDVEGEEMVFYYHKTQFKDNTIEPLEDCDIVEFNQSTYVITYEEATSGDWENQFALYPNLENAIPLDPEKKYSLNFVVGASEDMKIFFKIVGYDAQKVENENKPEGVSGPEWGRNEVKAFEPKPVNIGEFTGFESSNLVLFFDFGGNKAGAKIYIKDICFEEVGEVVPEPGSGIPDYEPITGFEW